MLAYDSKMCAFLLFIGRLFMSTMFIVAGLTKIKIIDFIHIANTMAHMTVPMIISVIFELVGGLLLFLGWYTRFATLLLMVFVIAATYFLHSFWPYQGIDAQHLQNIQHLKNLFIFEHLKNLFIFGALLYLFVLGPGQFSLDRAWRNVE